MAYCGASKHRTLHVAPCNRTTREPLAGCIPRFDREETDRSRMAEVAIRGSVVAGHLARRRAGADRRQPRRPPDHRPDAPRGRWPARVGGGLGGRRDPRDHDSRVERHPACPPERRLRGSPRELDRPAAAGGPGGGRVGDHLPRRPLRRGRDLRDPHVGPRDGPVGRRLRCRGRREPLAGRAPE